MAYNKYLTKHLHTNSHMHNNLLVTRNQDWNTREDDKINREKLTGKSKLSYTLNKFSTPYIISECKVYLVKTQSVMAIPSLLFRYCLSITLLTYYHAHQLKTSFIHPYFSTCLTIYQSINCFVHQLINSFCLLPTYNKSHQLAVKQWSFCQRGSVGQDGGKSPPGRMITQQGAEHFRPLTEKLTTAKTDTHLYSSFASQTCSCIQNTPLNKNQH